MIRMKIPLHPLEWFVLALLMSVAMAGLAKLYQTYHPDNLPMCFEMRGAL